MNQRSTQLSESKTPRLSQPLGCWDISACLGGGALTASASPLYTRQCLPRTLSISHQPSCPPPSRQSHHAETFPRHPLTNGTSSIRHSAPRVHPCLRFDATDLKIHVNAVPRQLPVRAATSPASVRAPGANSPTTLLPDTLLRYGPDINSRDLGATICPRHR